VIPIKGVRVQLFGAFAGLGGLDLQSVVEAVELVEESDGRHQLDDFALVVKPAEAIEELVKTDYPGWCRFGKWLADD
jgi:hypothetical protein